MKDKKKLYPTTTEPIVKNIAFRIAGIIAAIGFLIIVVWQFVPHPTPSPPLPGHKSIPPALTQAEVDAFFESQVRPALDAYQIRNKKAVDRAVDRISREVEKYRDGIKPLVEDLTSWGTRLGIIRRIGSDLGEKWRGDPANATEVHCYVSGKFETHLFSDAKLNALLADSLKQFHDDLTASQNKLHADVKTAWKKSGHDEHELNLKLIIQEVNESVQAISNQMATDSVTVGVVFFITGFAIEEAMEGLVKAIITRVAAHISTSAATTTATSGGATASTTAAGGGGGTLLGGPAGTVIGVAVGLVVGLIADWWMTSKLEKKLTAECNQMIAGINNQILFGTSETSGLESDFMEFINLMRTAEEDGIRNAIQGIAQ